MRGKNLGINNTNKHLIPYIRGEEETLARRVIELAAQYGRYGYRRITAMLNQEGWMVNHKRVAPIWSLL